MGTGDGVDLIAAGREAPAAADWERARELGQRAFAAYRRDGSAVEAANVAFWPTFTEATNHGNYTAAGAWMSRAESVLEGVPECSAHGRLILYRAPFSNDMSERENSAASALVIARRFGDTDLEYEALALLGESRVAAGRASTRAAIADTPAVPAGTENPLRWGYCGRPVDDVVIE